MLIDADQDFLTASAEYYKRFFDKYIAALDQPYRQAITLFRQLETAPGKDYEAGNKEAFARPFSHPATTKVYDIDIAAETHQNALSAAIQIYRYYVQKGSLPEKLPATFPKDLFSGQPFEYEKTDTSFTLAAVRRTQKTKRTNTPLKLQNNLPLLKPQSPPKKRAFL